MRFSIQLSKNRNALDVLLKKVLNNVIITKIIDYLQDDDNEKDRTDNVTKYTCMV